jgi:hypothetical protein
LTDKAAQVPEKLRTSGTEKAPVSAILSARNIGNTASQNCDRFIKEITARSHLKHTHC